MNTSRHPFRRLLLSILLSVCLLLQACSFSGTSPGNNAARENAVSDAFTEFTDKLFKESISSDALSLNYTLSDPGTYGVSPDAGGFSPLSYENLKNAAPETENLLGALREFDKSALSLPQQILYDSLAYTLEMDLKGSEFLLFSRPLSPVTGVQAQLPVLLAEYSFHTEKDIENYFSLLHSIPEYFTSLLAFMEVQAQQNMLPCQNTVSAIADQCLAFLQEKGDRILISSFKKRIRDCTFLEPDTAKKFRKENKKLVADCIVPAYQKLTDGLNVLAASCGTDGALSSYENGKEYYKYLFAAETGSDTGVEEYYETLNDRLNKSRQTLLAYAKKAPSLFSGLAAKSGGSTSPEELLTTLSSAIAADFPKVSDVNFTVSYVDPSLEDYLSPAFYLTPPLDAYTENVIYINNSQRFAGSDLSTTLAHEGYPGHLYQNVYHRQQNHPLLSYALNFSGYSEGWATYAEIYSYKYLGYSKDEVGILRNNMIISLCIYGICDIGIHYYGWDETKVLEFLNQNGTYTEETAHSLYTNIIDEPGSYLKYTIGYMEFMKLKNAAKKQMADKYSEMAFHEFVLSAGPAPFPVLAKYMSSFLGR
ncbi:MAG: DUF885 domain-containing protein [Roseburia sp.]|nr:DUF885 domain-containing protein [Roseburia sp.]